MMPPAARKSRACPRTPGRRIGPKRRCPRRVGRWVG